MPEKSWSDAICHLGIDIATRRLILITAQQRWCGKAHPKMFQILFAVVHASGGHTGPRAGVEHLIPVSPAVYQRFRTVLQSAAT